MHLARAYRERRGASGRENHREGVFRVFYDELSKLIFEYNLEENPPAAARAYALAGIAHNDGSVACWDAKYTYWAPRPN